MRPSVSRSIVLAMLCAAAVSAEFIGGKATRDALFLTSLDVTALPGMLVATALCSVLLVAAYSVASRKVTPTVLVPVLFAVSGLLFVIEWLIRSRFPTTTAILVYLHISGAGPLLASGFWLITSEQFDPRTAKRRFGQIAAAGTLGGLFGAVLSERMATHFGVPSMLLFLAGLQFVTAWLVIRLGNGGKVSAPAVAADADALPLRSGLRVIADAPHLRNLTALVLLGTTSAALVDYLLKARAVERFGPGDSLLRFFALYYAVTSLISFAFQTLGTRPALKRFGLGLTTSTPSIALVAGGLGSFMVPGFGSILMARGAETIFRSAWFRAGYELFYTPLPAAEKRAAKSIIDVSVDRLGDAVGGGLIRLAVVFVPFAAQSPVILSAAVVTSVGAIVAAGQLNRWYVRSLANSLVHMGGHVELTASQDQPTARAIIARRDAMGDRSGFNAGTGLAGLVDPVIHDITVLRSGNVERIARVLSRSESLPAVLVPHAIALLGTDAVADVALFALRKVAEERVGELTDALLDPNQSPAVRGRLARVFSVAVSQRAVDSLLLALDDERFDVRFHAARSLVAIQEKNFAVRVDRARIEAVVLREVAIGRPIWESKRLLDGVFIESPLDEFVRDRAGQSLAHVFTLLSTISPREPLQIAFRSLHSEDRVLRGTALEYLEGVLPTPIRDGLWPFLRRPRTPAPPAVDRQELVEHLVRDNRSTTLLHIAGQLKAPGTAGFDLA